jgi:hypothetical protein
MRGRSLEPGNTVLPEFVEGHSFSCVAKEEEEGFDKLSPNGLGVLTPGGHA